MSCDNILEQPRNTHTCARIHKGNVIKMRRTQLWIFNANVKIGNKIFSKCCITFFGRAWHKPLVQNYSAFKYSPFTYSRYLIVTLDFSKPLLKFFNFFSQMFIPVLRLSQELYKVSLEISTHYEIQSETEAWTEVRPYQAYGGWCPRPAGPHEAHGVNAYTKAEVCGSHRNNCAEEMKLAVNLHLGMFFVSRMAHRHVIKKKVGCIQLKN